MSGLHAGLPLRPMTTAELLDAAIALLRRHARVLLPVGALLALGREALLLPLRLAGDSAPPYYLPYQESLGWYWLQLAAALASEGFVIALLGTFAGRAAGAALVGAPSPRLLQRAGSRFGAVLLVSCLVAAVTGVCALAGLVLWPVAYGLLGLAVPALVIDRLGVGRALLRSLRLSTAGGLRGLGVRLLGWFSWLAIRLALGIGALKIVGTVFDPDALWLKLLLATVVWTLVDGLAYAVLACLDAVLHLELRMRTEGLDIWLVRHRGTGPGPGGRPAPDPAVLAVPR